MKNKVSTIVKTIPMENKLAKAQLKQIYLDIEDANKKKEEALLNSELILGASQEKEQVFAELEIVKTELNENTAKLIEVKDNLVTSGVESLKLDREIENKQAKLAEFDGLEEKITLAKKELLVLDEKNKEIDLLAVQFNTLQSKISKLEDDFKKKQVEIAESLKPILENLLNKEAELKTLNNEIANQKLTSAIAIEAFNEIKKEYDLVSNEVSGLVKSKLELKEEIEKERKEKFAVLDKELSDKQTEFVNANKERLDDIVKREGDVSVDEKRLEKKKKELIEAKKNLEDFYGRKISNIHI